MKLCLMSKCVFDCPEKGVETNSLEQAMEWHKSGYCVHLEFDGEYVGYITYGGSVAKVEHLPNGADNGVVVYCEEDGTLYINLPDHLLESMPEE